MYPMRKIHSCLSLFSRDEGQASVFHGSGPTAAEEQRRLRSQGSQVELVEKFEKGMNLLKASAVSSSAQRVSDALFRVIDPADSAILSRAAP